MFLPSRTLPGGGLVASKTCPILSAVATLNEMLGVRHCGTCRWELGNTKTKSVFPRKALPLGPSSEFSEFRICYKGKPMLRLHSMTSWTLYISDQAFPAHSSSGAGFPRKGWVVPKLAHSRSLRKSWQTVALVYLPGKMSGTAIYSFEFQLSALPNGFPEPPAQADSLESWKCP